MSQFYEKIKQWLPPEADVNLPLSAAMSLYWHLRGKRIVGDHRTIIRGLLRLDTSEGHLTVGKSAGMFHRDDRVLLDLRGKMKIKGGVYLGKGCRVMVMEGAEVELKGCHFTGLAKIIAHDRVTVGAGSVIAWEVEIMDWDSHQIIYDGQKEKACGVEIGEGVWIGAGARILRGVTIGAGSVIAAGAVVTRSCPPKSLMAGNPARVIRESVSWTNYAEEGGLEK